MILACQNLLKLKKQLNKVACSNSLRNNAINTCDSYCLQENSIRKKVAKLISNLAKDNPKVPSNILHALKKITPSHLMDKNHWDFDSIF